MGWTIIWNMTNIWWCCCSVTKSCLTLCDLMNHSMPGSSVLQCLPELVRFMSIESVMLSKYLILCCPMSFCLQSFPASGSFPVSQFSASGSQSIGASASASVLSINTQGWFLLGLTSLISLESNRLSRVFSTTKNLKTSILQCSVFFTVQLSSVHDYWKSHSFAYMNCC